MGTTWKTESQAKFVWYMTGLLAILVEVLAIVITIRAVRHSTLGDHFGAAFLVIFGWGPWFMGRKIHKHLQETRALGNQGQDQIKLSYDLASLINVGYVLLMVGTMSSRNVFG